MGYYNFYVLIFFFYNYKISEVIGMNVDVIEKPKKNISEAVTIIWSWSFILNTFNISFVTVVSHSNCF